MPATLPVGGDGGSDHGPHARIRVAAAVPRGHQRSNRSAIRRPTTSTNYWVTNLRPAMPENVATSARDPASWPHLNFAAMSLGTEGILPSGNQSNVEVAADGRHAAVAEAAADGHTSPTSPASTTSGTRRSTAAAASSTRSRPTSSSSAWARSCRTSSTRPALAPGAAFQSASVSGAEQFHLPHVVRARLGRAACARYRSIRRPARKSSVAWDASAQLRGAAHRRAGSQGHAVVHRPQDRHHRRNGQRGSVPRGQHRRATSSIRWRRERRRAAKAILEFLRGNRQQRRHQGRPVPRPHRRPARRHRRLAAGLCRPAERAVPRGQRSGLHAQLQERAAFKTAPARVYVGANDGMLHAFDDATGNEAWAFVPSDLYRPDETGLGALSYQDGALPPFEHHFYVDCDAADQRRQLRRRRHRLAHACWSAGSARAASRTTRSMSRNRPTSPARPRRRKRVLWEFTDADMGYTYGRAIIAKTHAFGGQWVVIVPSGYNNAGSGEGKIFILRASDGKLLKTLSTGVGSDAPTHRAWRRSPRTRRTSATSSPSRSTAATCRAISGASTSPIRTTAASWGAPRQDREPDRPATAIRSR